MGSTMTEITCRIIRSDTNYRAEAIQPGRVMHVAEGFASESDAQGWIEEFRRLLTVDNRRQRLSWSDEE
jgi:hypothetical protein